MDKPDTDEHVVLVRLAAWDPTACTAHGRIIWQNATVGTLCLLTADAGALAALRALPAVQDAWVPRGDATREG